MIPSVATDAEHRHPEARSESWLSAFRSPFRPTAPRSSDGFADRASRWFWSTGDGEVAYEALVPHLADRFTCYTPSTRGRGPSGDNPDHAVHHLVEDVVAFIDTIGEPV